MSDEQKVRKYLVRREPRFGSARRPWLIVKSVVRLVVGCAAWSLIGVVSLYILAFAAEVDFNDTLLVVFTLGFPVLGYFVGGMEKDRRHDGVNKWDWVWNSIRFSLDDLRAVFSPVRKDTLAIAVEVLLKSRASRKPLRLEPLLENFADKGVSRAEVAQALGVLKELDLVSQAKKGLQLLPRGRHLY